MAKRKPAESAGQAPEEVGMRAVLAGLAGEYGDAIVSGEDYASAVPARIPWSPVMDVLFSGGIEQGSWVGLTGGEKLGKTVAALCLAARAQESGMAVYYDKVEGRLSREHLAGIRGLDLSPGRFSVIQSTRKKCLTAQDHLGILLKLMHATEKSLFIIDSISAYLTEEEVLGGVGHQDRGGGTKLFAQFVRLMSQTVPVRGHVVVGITQMYSNTGGFGAANVEKAARAWKHQCDYQARAVKKTLVLTNKGRPLGIKTEWQCLTSKNGPPGMKMEAFLRYGVGLDRLQELVDLGCALGIITKRTSWLSLPFIDGEPKANGAEAMRALLEASPAWAEELGRRVGEASSSLSFAGEP